MNKYESRRHLDRTDHRRAAEARRRDRRGPTEEQIARALSEVESHDIPGTPHVGVLKVLSATDMSLPIHAGSRVLRAFSVRSGDPRHGAKRSDDHVGHYTVAYPGECPSCDHDVLVFEYSAYHYIAGGDSIACDACEYVVESDEWG